MKVDATPVQCFLSDLDCIAACVPKSVEIYTEQIEHALEDSGLRAELREAAGVEVFGVNETDKNELLLLLSHLARCCNGGCSRANRARAFISRVECGDSNEDAGAESGSQETG